MVVGAEAVEFDYMNGPLKPRAGRMPHSYYFDHYQWGDEAQIARIRPDGGFEVFADDFIRSAGDPFRPGSIFVISGANQTGRTSLENLLIFEVERRKQLAPVRIRFTMTMVSDKLQAARDLADAFIFDLASYLEDMGRADDAAQLSEKLNVVLRTWVERGASANPEFLFLQLNREVRRKLPDAPIVFCCDASNHTNTPDLWYPACVMLRNLADVVILSLSRANDAKRLRTRLQDNYSRSVAWVDAPRIDLKQAAELLEIRLDSARTSTARRPLFPFADDAMAALFAPTGDQPITFPIGFVVKYLKSAFDRKCAEIKELITRRPAEELTEAQMTITAADMRRLYR